MTLPSQSTAQVQRLVERVQASNDEFAARVLAQPCSYCGMPAGHRCRTDPTGMTRRPHAARERAAIVAKYREA